MSFAPPTAWAQADLGAAAYAPGGGAEAVDDAFSPLSGRALEEAGRMLDEDEARQPDLVQQLRAETGPAYAPPPSGWPPLFKLLPSSQLPSVVLERLSTRQVCTFCGLLPEIGRAWATVDASLFLWRYDVNQPGVRDEAPVEKTLDEQAIVSLSLCLPRPGVFYADITHLLVLATPVEIVLLGACLSPDGAHLALQDLPHYSCPSNGVLVTAAACTSPAAGGRVLLGGADGGLHELRYSAETSWRARRCALVSHCGLGGLLPSPLRRLLWTQPLPVRQLVLDETRGAAYARLDGGVIAVYDIAAGGGRWVAELRRLDAALRRENVRGGGGGGGGGRAPARAPPRAPPPADSPVIAIQLVQESAEATLQAVCGDGRRIFLSAYARGSSAPLAAAPSSASPALRPSCLRPVAARDAPPHSASAAAAQAASPGTPPFALAVPPPLQAEAALCCPGLLVLVERPEAAPPASPAAPAARLLLAAADAGGGGFAASGAPLCLLEYVESAQLPGLVAAESGALAELPPPPAAAPLAPLYPGGGAAAGALASQHAAPPRCLAALTSEGVLLLQQQRPVDVLADILGGPAARPLLEDFFRHYGAVEAAAMCCQLAAGGGGAPPPPPPPPGARWTTRACAASRA